GFNEGVPGLGPDLADPAVTTGLIVEPAGRTALLAGDLALRAINDPLGAMVLGIEGIGTVLVIYVAANLNARVEPRVALDFHFEDEILVVSFTKKRVGTSFDSGSHDRAVFDLVGREAAVDGPAIERLAIKEGRPPCVVPERGERKSGYDRQGRHEPEVISHAFFSKLRWEGFVNSRGL